MTYEYLRGMGQMMTLSMPASTSGGGTTSSGSSVMSLVPGAIGTPTIKTAIFTGLQFVIPAGYVPIPAEDRDWFKRWLRTSNPTAYKNHEEKDPSFIYADPNILARFIDGKAQVEWGLADVWDLAVGSGGRPLSGSELERATEYFDAMMKYWVRCDRSGGAAWASAESGTTVMKLPRPYVDRWPMSIWKMSLPTRCPELADARSWWGVPRNEDRTKGTDLLAAYIAEKDAQRASTAQTQQEQLAQKQREIADAQAQANAAQQTANALQGTVSDLQAQLAQATNDLDAVRSQAAAGAPVDNAALAALQAQVTALTNQLSAANTQLEESRREADLAEEAVELETQALELAEESFFSRNKWYLAIGGLAAVGAGLWYYYFKYLPSKQMATAPAPTANPDEDPIYDDRGRFIGTIWPAAVPGRWVARSAKLNQPLYSATSPERAVEWLEDTAESMR